MCFFAEKNSYHFDQGEPGIHPASVEFDVNDRVDDMFFKLVTGIGNILKNSNCEFALLRSACVKVDVLLAKASKLPNEFIDKINATKNLNELLALLSESLYCNWMNIRMLEKLAASSCQVDAQQLIAKYKKAIFSKKISDVLEDLPDFEITDEYYAKVRDKWEKDFEDVTIADITKRWAKLQKIFDVDDLELLLDNVIKGSTEIVWLIPVDLISHAKLSAFKNWCDLEDVSYLSIGDHVIKNDQLKFTEEHISITTGMLT